MKDNEIKFIQLVTDSPSNFVPKLEKILKLKILSQLSRPMLIELFGYWNEIDPKFNGKAVCMQCASSLFNIVKTIALKFFELKTQYENTKLIPTEDITTIELTPKQGDLIENLTTDTTKEIIDSQLSLFEQDVDTVEVNDNITEEKNEKVNTELDEKIDNSSNNMDITNGSITTRSKRGRPKQI